MNERLGIIGAGTIATGLAATAAGSGEVMMWARSPDKARTRVDRVCEKCGADASRVRITRDLDDIAGATILIEAITEDLGVKSALYRELPVANGALLATTTSSLPISRLNEAAGHPGKFVGLHVFNPVPKMKLVELVFPDDARDETRDRARALCEALGKTPVEVPDVPGFVVNRLLFPYLFSAVRLMEETGLDPAKIDTCMTLGTGQPMGPLALLDLVGLDIAKAIGEEIGAEIPQTVERLVQDGALGRKTGRGITL